MTRLILAEMNRLRSRRFALIGTLLIIALLAVFQLAVFQAVKAPSTAEMAEAQRFYQEAQQDYQKNKEMYQQQAADCVEQGNAPEMCTYPEPELSDFQRTPETFFEMGSTATTLSVFLAGLILLFVGGSFIGGEYSSGSISNWLSFIPERGKVFFSKLVGLTIPAAMVSLVASALTLACTAILVTSQGGEVTAVGNLVEMAARGIVLVVIMAVLGFCIALVARHTVAAVGAVLAYLFLSFVRQALALNLPALQKLPPWLPESNLSAFLNHGSSYFLTTQTRQDDGSFSFDQVERTISFSHSAIYFAVVLIVVVGGSYLIFRRRDVT